MAGLAISLEVSGIDAALARLNALGRVAESEELADGLGALGVSQTQRRIESEKTTPEGAAWASNREGTSILFRTGSHLRDSIDHSVRGAHEVAWGSGWIGARVHQFGATIKPVNGAALKFWFRAGNSVDFAVVKSVTIPAREYLGVSADNERELVETAERFVRIVLQ